MFGRGSKNQAQDGMTVGHSDPGVLPDGKLTIQAVVTKIGQSFDELEQLISESSGEAEVSVSLVNSIASLAVRLQNAHASLFFKKMNSGTVPPKAQPRVIIHALDR